MNSGTFFLKIYWSFQPTPAAVLAQQQTKEYSSAGHRHLFRPLAPWISFSHLLLHLFLLFRNKVPAQNVSGSGGRRWGTARTVEHRKNKKDQISNTLCKRQRWAAGEEYGCAIRVDVTEPRNKSRFYLRRASRAGCKKWATTASRKTKG